MSTAIHGVGVGLRRVFARELAATERPLDWLEITPENWMFFGGERRHLLDACAERWPLSPHGVSLNVGGIDPLDDTYLDGMRALCRRLDAPWWSDHLCYSSIGGRPLHDLLPLPFTDEAVENAAARARRCEERVGAPLVIENATFYSHMPGATMDEAAFLRAFLDASGCGMLLDVNNVYVNAQNHGFDACAFIDRMPLERVRQIHVAGHTDKGDLIVDTHIGPIIDEVWALYRYTLARAGRMIPTLVEWDQEIPPLERVLDEVDRARAEAAAALTPTIATSTITGDKPPLASGQGPSTGDKPPLASGQGPSEATR
jgi:uncharacterized protein (UPF0276 family)